MGLKKRNKVNAQFNMSSLTDIIFLLLIFFMLTSTLVAPNALNLKLPSSSRAQSSSNQVTDVEIKRDGRFYFDGSRVSANEMERKLRRLAERSGSKQADITISPQKNTPVEHVVMIMDLAMRYEINAILAAERD